MPCFSEMYSTMLSVTSLLCFYLSKLNFRISLEFIHGPMLFSSNL